MIFIIALLLALMVILASLYMLARGKKEEWSKIYAVAAYISLSLGLLFFVGSTAAGIAKAMCHSKCHKENSCGYSQGQCSMAGHGQSCHKGAWGQGHGMMQCRHSCGMKMNGHEGCMTIGNCKMHKKMRFGHGNPSGDATIEVEVQKVTSEDTE